MRAEKTLAYLQASVKRLLKQGQFDNSWEFRPSQLKSLVALDKHLNDKKLSVQDRLLGFFVLPTGTGKTPLFIAIATGAQEAAKRKKETLKLAVVVPTRKLLDQTYQAFGKMIPEADAKKVGRYGDERYELGHDINIYTYHAWVKLTREGKLGSHNVDILVSDEAHRGTSEVRVEEIFAKYEDNGTACLAFTATYQFDEEGQKSVQRTHKHKVIERDINTCIKDGELAAYIATQFYIVRVMPPKTYPPDVDPDDYDRRWLKNAWIERMVAIARDGQDDVTGDPLHDNQMAFYCQDTQMADEMAEALNDDKTFRKLFGEGGVAVSVHSRMLKTEQRQRLEDVEKRECVALCGNDMFKEGYDYPALKTIFDGPHGSVVDKVQIIGRGARYWENDMKDDRLEGLTFVDSIIYMGNDDPEEDARNEWLARRNAITAIKVLKGTYVYGPSVKPQQKKVKGPPKPPIKINGQDVKAYVTLEEAEVFAGEQERIEKQRAPYGYIEITEEMMLILKAEQERTRVMASAICKAYPELGEAGINTDKIGDLCVGNTRWTQSQWDLLISCYKKQEPVNRKMRVKPGSGEKITITQPMIQKLESEQERTGLKAQAICGLCSELELAGITLKKVERVYAGSSAWTQSQWDLLMACYQRQKTVRLEPTIVITQTMIAQLEKEQKRTGMMAFAIHKACPELEIAGIKWNKTNKVSTSSVNWTQSEWDLLMNCYRRQRDLDPDRKRPLSSHVKGSSSTALTPPTSTRDDVDKDKDRRRGDRGR